MTIKRSSDLPRRQAGPTTQLILASSSEWRARILKDAGLEFEILPTDFDEAPYQQSIHDPELLVKTLAEKKAESCKETIQRSNDPTIKRIILAADTIVWINDQIIGKPINRQDAKRIISLLAGSTHEVWTGVCICRGEARLAQPEKTTFAEKTQVTFSPMTNQEIEDYLDTGDWVGKAGAYQFQQHIHKYITHIEGDENNIIGLPKKAILYLE